MTCFSQTQYTIAASPDKAKYFGKIYCKHMDILKLHGIQYVLSPSGAKLFDLAGYILYITTVSGEDYIRVRYEQNRMD